MWKLYYNFKKADYNIKINNVTDLYALDYKIARWKTDGFMFPELYKLL